jgi:hypothetical protein
MNYQYDALSKTESVRIKDITSTAANRALLHRIKNNDPGLKSLYIDTFYQLGMGTFQVREGDDLGWLGYFIGGNETLTRLIFWQLPEDREREEEFFFGVQRNKSIKRVEILGRVFPTKSLPVMNLPHVTSMTLNTAITAVGLHSLKQYFRSPSCALKDLSIISSINIGDEGAYALADALGQNKSLKRLRFEERGITLRGWKAFLKLICDSSSPNSIYLSHHTLCKLGDRCFGGWGWRLSGSVRTSLDTFLGMNNQTPNLAAKVKIMHVFPDLDMVLLFQWNTKFLPLVKRWFDTVTSDDSAFAASVQNRKLSAIYKFVRAIAGCKLLPTSSHSAASEYQS